MPLIGKAFVWLLKISTMVKHKKYFSGTRDVRAKRVIFTASKS
jgi:hypothetical protein